MSRNKKDDFVATKSEKTFDDDGNIKVAKLDKKKLNIIRQSGQKAGTKFSINKFFFFFFSPFKFILRHIVILSLVYQHFLVKEVPPLLSSLFGQDSYA